MSGPLGVSGIPAPADDALDIAEVLDRGRWGGYQQGVLALAALAIVLDGFDNQLLSFAAPAILRDWGLTRAAFGPVFLLGFVGMVLGTLVGGWLGDRFGRRTALIANVLVFGACTMLVSQVQGVVGLAVLRVVAGLGLGGALPGATALIAEFTPVKRRSIAVTGGIVCIPLGGALGGVVAAAILPQVGWRVLFLVGGALALGVAGVLAARLPESPRFLLRRPQRAARLAAVLRRLGAGNATAQTRFVDSAPALPANQVSLLALFTREYRADTLALWAACFCCFISNYLVVNWVPLLFGAAGFGLAASSVGLTLYNFGGVAGSVGTSLAITRYGSRRALLSVATLAVLTAGVLLVMGLDPAATSGLFAAMLVLGAAINAVQTCLFAVAVQAYPPQIAATGVGGATGVGRSGAIVSSLLGATIVGGGSALYFTVVAGAMALSLLAMVLFRRHTPAV